ncbi:XdhC family protein [bacterium]|nr:XdhC family protein [bacterium]
MNFYENLLSLLRSEQQIALVTVVRTEGSVPRKAGTKMLVDAKGTMLGTIGGGCPEAEAGREATEVAALGGCKICHIEMRHGKEDLRKAERENQDVLICGGFQEVLMEPLSREIPNGELMLKALQSMEHGDAPSVLLAVWMEEGDPSPIPNRCGTIRSANMQRFVYWPDGRVMGTSIHPIPDEWLRVLRETALCAENIQSCVCQEADMGALRCRVYAEPMELPLRLFIAGAGHVAVPLCHLAAMCGYRVSVVDDRAEFATKERFPDAAEVITADFVKYFSELKIDAATSVVIVTRGHRWDEQCLHAINGRRMLYLGMIGSHHRTAIVRDRLREMGYPQSWIDSLNAPIGLDIGAETPEEIAVAIVAQMIAQRYSGVVRR